MFRTLLLRLVDISEKNYRMSFYYEDVIKQGSRTSRDQQPLIIEYLLMPRDQSQSHISERDITM